jgi:hypothetical protein
MGVEQIRQPSAAVPILTQIADQNLIQRPLVPVS